jgi:hypothetical protein
MSASYKHAHTHTHSYANYHLADADSGCLTGNFDSERSDFTHCHLHFHGTVATHHDCTGLVAGHRRQPSVRELAEKAKQVPTGQETRVKNATTGGEKGSKLSQLSSAPAEALALLGEVYGFGAQKYERHNFRKGYAWSLSYDAMLRHLLASLAGEDRDPESGLYHLAHLTWHGLTLLQFLIDKEAGRHPVSLDDRWKYEETISG